MSNDLAAAHRSMTARAVESALKEAGHPPDDVRRLTLATVERSSVLADGRTVVRGEGSAPDLDVIEAALAASAQARASLESRSSPAPQPSRPRSSSPAASPSPDVNLTSLMIRAKQGDADASATLARLSGRVSTGGR